MKSFDQRVEEVRVEYVAVQDDARLLYELGLRHPSDVKEAVFRAVHPSFRSDIVGNAGKAKVKVIPKWWYGLGLGSGVAATLIGGAFWLGFRAGTASGSLEAAEFSITGTETTLGPGSFPLDVPPSHSMIGPSVSFRFKRGQSGTVTVIPRDDASNPREVTRFRLGVNQMKSVRLARGKGNFRLFLVTAAVDGGDDPQTRTVFVLFP